MVRAQAGPHFINCHLRFVVSGCFGSLLYWKGEIYEQKKFTVRVADTVGAGDSFLASLIVKLLSHETPQRALDFAGAVGALVATYKGANPEIRVGDVEQMLEQN